MEEQAKKPDKQYYTVKVEANAPISLTYRVLAESPEEAFELVAKGKGKLSEPPKPNLSRIKKIKAVVYQAGNLLVRLSRNF